MCINQDDVEVDASKRREASYQLLLLVTLQYTTHHDSSRFNAPPSTVSNRAFKSHGAHVHVHITHEINT
jgi:hypothetical protein